MSTIAVVAGAADIDALQSGLPGHRLVATADLEGIEASLLPTVAAIIVRSGIRIQTADAVRMPNLRAVLRAGSGTDNIDVDALVSRGITIRRNPHAGAQAVGEWVLTAALCLARRIPLGHNGIVNGQHLKAECMGANIRQLHAAVWGAGPVGKQAFAALQPFTSHIEYVSWPSLANDLPNRPSTELIRDADIHVIAVPLRQSTRGLIGAAFLSQVQARRPLLICAGRPETLSLPECLDALAAGDLGGLAIDAIDSSHAFAAPQLPAAINLLLSPHIGAQRTDVREALDQWLTATIRETLGHGDQT